MNTFTKLFPILLLAVGLLIALPLHAFAAGELDGKAFTAVVDGEQDILSFENGMFHSSACDQYGFGKGAYTTTTTDAGITFEATTMSDKEGQMVWSGTVSGDTLNGRYVWTKEGFFGTKTKDQQFEGTLR